MVDTALFREKVGDALDRFKPDAVAIPGWASREALAVLSWCLRRCCPAILMSETQAMDEKRVWWKEAVKRQLVGLYSSALVGGHRHADYLLELGLKSDSIFFGYDAVDNAYFEQGAQLCRGASEEWRHRLQLPENYFLASARFIPKKNLSTLLSSYAAYRDAAGAAAWDLVLLGDGPMRKELEMLRNRLGLECAVHLPGFQQYPLLPCYYALARAFVHASSTEQWGLVVNEAMAAGLPVIVSDQCGCSADLVRSGENGFVFDSKNSDALVFQMMRLTQLEGSLKAMGMRSQELIADWSPTRFGEGLLQAANRAVHGMSKPDKPLGRWMLESMLLRMA